MVNQSRLFLGSCFALITTAFSFSIRAGILKQLGAEYGFSNEQLGTINQMWFLGFPISMIVGGLIYQAIGGKKIMQFAFLSHTLGILLTIYSGGSYAVLLVSTLFIGLGNGCTEAACNPMIADAYEGNKMSTMLNRFHMWFPGGIVIGSLISKFMTDAALPWQSQIWIIMIPTIIYAFLFWGQLFPQSKTIQGSNKSANYKVSIPFLSIAVLFFILYSFSDSLGISNLAGSSTSLILFSVAIVTLLIGVYSLFGGLFLFMFVCMALTSISEFGPGQWIDLILGSSGANPMILLALTTGTMAIARFFAGSIVHRFDQTGVLLGSAVLAAIGLYLYSSLTGDILYVVAIVYACGIAFFWPNMVGFIADKIPQSGALGMSVIGGIGMFSSSLFQPIIGRWIDEAHTQKAAEGLTGNALELAAGQATLSTMVLFPLILIVAFIGLFFYMKNRKKIA
ncbi:sugar MFS transporter [Emticicia sp. 21SJ11W-3]|uniref:MFS transporter n=1 Tax=Emticicia sp. 21SJ11W-3 TaxID=2916755 RepID=UPI00209FAA30|nr:MFS transporter [Emticicia sp. 21SJ11W-3]UTA70345.1 MFS transporter [Emticicia sp. 21SJ11W-3]